MGPYLSYPGLSGYKNICVSTRTSGKTKELSSAKMGPINSSSSSNLYALWKSVQFKPGDVIRNGKIIKHKKNIPVYKADFSDRNEEKTLFY